MKETRGAFSFWARSLQTTSISLMEIWDLTTCNMSGRSFTRLSQSRSEFGLNFSPCRQMRVFPWRVFLPEIRCSQGK